MLYFVHAKLIKLIDWRMNKRKAELQRGSDPAHSLASAHLVSHSAKWVQMSTCQFQKAFIAVRCSLLCFKVWKVWREGTSGACQPSAEHADHLVWLTIVSSFFQHVHSHWIQSSLLSCRINMLTRPCLLLFFCLCIFVLHRQKSQVENGFTVSNRNLFSMGHYIPSHSLWCENRWLVCLMMFGSADKQILQIYIPLQVQDEHERCQLTEKLISSINTVSVLHMTEEELGIYRQTKEVWKQTKTLHVLIFLCNFISIRIM